MIEHRFFRLWLLIGILAGFATTVFFSITYLNEKVLCDVDCRLRNEVTVVLVLLSLFGMFVGSLTYYFISEKYERKLSKMHKDASTTLRFLEGSQRAIVSCLAKSQGSATQSAITRDTGLSRVKVSRSIAHLEAKGVVTKRPEGMTNIVELDEELTELLAQ